MKGFGSLLGRGWLLGLIAVLLLGLLMWFGGPYVAIAEKKPLESVVGRLVGLLVLVVVWALIVQIRMLKGARSGDKLASAVAGQADVAAVEGSGTNGRAATSDAAAMRDRFSRAVAQLRRGNRTRSLYDLPWYVIVGPPGSGKTTALMNAGLQFPLEKEFGRDPLKGVGGTRNCDWWITDDAILLDTAGRFVTQDSNQIADRAGWSEFLALLRKYRRRRPINGVLLTISIADLLHASAEERERQALAIRARLEELHSQLKISLPVYLLLTKVDLMAGFNEFFGQFNRVERSQVWGVTFPLEMSREGDALQELPKELDRLVARLQDQSLMRMGAERDVGRRAAMQSFPAQVGALKRPLTEFLAEIVRGTTLTTDVWFRGCYLTSGTQAGTPIDRMLMTMARNFGLGIQAVGNAPVSGKSFFLETLLKQVVFAESGLAGVNKKLEIQLAARRVAGYALVAALAAFGILSLLWSYRVNRLYVEELDKLTQQVTAEAQPAMEGGIEAALQRLDALRLIHDATLQHAADGVPWRMRAGLYQGRTASAAAGDAYRRGLNAWLGPWAGRHLEQGIEQLAAEPDALYAYLKAYLMLVEPRRIEPQVLLQVGDAEWQRMQSRDPGFATQVRTHYSAWVAEPDRVQPVRPDLNLIEQARVSLQQASPPLLMYSRLRMAYVNKVEGRILLDRELSVGSASLLVRRSGKSLSEPVSALYTRAAFEEFTRTGRLQLLKQFLDDAWVLGDRAPQLTESPQLAGEVLRLYEADYIRAWDELLSDLVVRPSTGPADVGVMIGLLGSPTSPLKRVLMLVDQHTNLLKASAADPSAAGAAAAKIGSAVAGLDQMLGAGGAGTTKPGAAVTTHFQAFHRLVEGPAGSAPIDQTLQSVAQLQQQLQAAGGGAAGATAAAAALRQLELVAAQLPGPMAALVTEVGKSGAAAAMGAVRAELGDRYVSEVVRDCRDLVGGRYPLNGTSTVDVTPADFGRVFGPGGTYEKFFQTQLQSLVDNSRSRWSWKEETQAVAAVPLAPFQQAERIRQSLFSPGVAVPKLQLTLTPEYLDAEANRFTLNVDGQVLEYSHGPRQPIPIAWPSLNPTGVSLSFEDRNGARPNRSFAGSWGLLRLFDAAQVQAVSDTRFVLTLREGGRTARVVLTADSARNPFRDRDLLRFACGG